MTERSPKVESLIEHYKELSETVSGDPAVGEQNAQVARRVIAKIKADALREAAGQIRHKQHPESVRQMLRRSADRIEGATND